MRLIQIRKTAPMIATMKRGVDMTGRRRASPQAKPRSRNPKEQSLGLLDHAADPDQENGSDDSHDDRLMKPPAWKPSMPTSQPPTTAPTMPRTISIATP